MNDHKYVPQRCAENNPHRCQGSTAKGGQCPFLAVPPTQFCPIHGNHTIRHETEETLYQFNRTEVLHRLQELRKHPAANKLTEELGILRLTLETLLNRCEDNYDLVTNSAAITNLILSIEKTLSTNVKLEQRLNDLLSLEQVIEMAQSFFNVITEHINDPQILDVIATRFEEVMVNPPKVSK